MALLIFYTYTLLNLFIVLKNYFCKLNKKVIQSGIYLKTDTFSDIPSKSTPKASNKNGN